MFSWAAESKVFKIFSSFILWLFLFMSSSFVFVAVKNFVLIPQHTSPESAVLEIDALYDVVSDVRTHWDTNVNTL